MNGASGAKNKLQVAERQNIYRAETFRGWVNKIDGTFSAPRTALEEAHQFVHPYMHYFSGAKTGGRVLTCTPTKRAGLSELRKDTLTQWFPQA